MSQLDLLKATDELATMIATARTALGSGKAVDLVPIEERVTAIYSEVSASAFTPQEQRLLLLSRLNTLMPELAALETDLTAAQGSGAN